MSSGISAEPVTAASAWQLAYQTVRCSLNPSTKVTQLKAWHGTRLGHKQSLLIGEVSCYTWQMLSYPGGLTSYLLSESFLVNQCTLSPLLGLVLGKLSNMQGRRPTLISCSGSRWTEWEMTWRHVCRRNWQTCSDCPLLEEREIYYCSSYNTLANVSSM